MRNQLKPGDVVKLKSGGPEMTVKEIVIGIPSREPNGIIRCTWFEGTQLKRAEFRF